MTPTPSRSRSASALALRIVVATSWAVWMLNCSWALAQTEEREAAGTDLGKDDPATFRCLPPGPRALYAAQGWARIIQTPRLIAILYEDLRRCRRDDAVPEHGPGTLSEIRPGRQRPAGPQRRQTCDGPVPPGHFDHLASLHPGHDALEVLLQLANGHRLYHVRHFV